MTTEILVRRQIEESFYNPGDGVNEAGWSNKMVETMDEFVPTGRWFIDQTGMNIEYNLIEYINYPVYGEEYEADHWLWPLVRTKIKKKDTVGWEHRMVIHGNIYWANEKDILWVNDCAA